VENVERPGRHPDRRQMFEPAEVTNLRNRRSGPSVEQGT
jgi:hypothetical protein